MHLLFFAKFVCSDYFQGCIWCKIHLDFFDQHDLRLSKYCKRKVLQIQAFATVFGYEMQYLCMKGIYYVVSTKNR